MENDFESDILKNGNPAEIRATKWVTGRSELKDHILARLGYKRMSHRVVPGLYSLGHPRSESPVFVTANYTLSFDALRSSLKNIDGYILVLDTDGVNVWCAAGKGTFGTNELVKRIELTRLRTVVSHRKLILPQLSGPGVNAFEVQKRTGFKVEYGPVRAKDIREFIGLGRATPEMRHVRFDLIDRLTLIPVELTSLALPLAVAVVVLGLLGGLFSAGAVAVAVLSGVVLFPIVLPWLPTRDFSSKGFILGMFTTLPFAILAFIGIEEVTWLRLVYALTLELLMPPVTAYIALNFTGSTTFTSRSGVRREIFKYIPLMAVSLVVGGILFFGSIMVQYVM